MEVIWTKSAKQDLINYQKNSHIINIENINSYIISLINYVDTLANMPKIGKLLFKINNIEIRQLIYKMHRILYSLINDTVYILVISHTTRDYEEIIKYIKDFFNNTSHDTYIK